MKELFNVLRHCMELSNKILSVQTLENKSQAQRNELKYNKDILFIQLTYLDELIQRELKEKNENDR